MPENITSANSDEPPLARHHFFPSVSDADWSDPKWQVANTIRTLEQVKTLKLPYGDLELEALGGEEAGLHMAVTPYCLSLARDPFSLSDPILRQCLPRAAEFAVNNRTKRQQDPLHEEDYSPVPGIVHRYPDRCL